MINSMTGYGRADFEIANDTFSVEVKSLNHRYLDIKIKGPESFYWAEQNIRAVLKQSFSRGNVSVFIRRITRLKAELTLNVEQVEACLKAAYDLRALGIKGELDVAYLLSRPDIFLEIKSEQDTDADWHDLKCGLEEAVNAVMQWRLGEGERLKEDVLTKLAVISKLTLCVEERLPGLDSAYRERLLQRIRDLIDKDVDEARLITEAALVADRSAIDEEIVRLKSHLKSFTEFLDSTEPVGRKLDFLCQEILREVNTIGSKVSDVEVTHTVVDIKAELEKVREQVQNIE